VHDFGKVAYLDLHKTGSSYISEFLNSCCKLEQLSFVKHDWVRDNFRDDCFYFISIRNPLQIYSSLYRFGLEKKGDVYGRLKNANMLSTYKTFDTFVGFCLQNKNADFLGFGYSAEISKSIGFISFRFLKLSLQFPMRKIHNCLSEGRHLKTLQEDFITRLEIKNETLKEDLRKLSLDLLPEYFDKERVESFLGQDLLINTSTISANDIGYLSNETLINMHHKEWLLNSRYLSDNTVEGVI
jgi:hypothetical protein